MCVLTAGLKVKLEERDEAGFKKIYCLTQISLYLNVLISQETFGAEFIL